jgi:hypothetical protein
MASPPFSRTSECLCRRVAQRLGTEDAAAGPVHQPEVEPLLDLFQSLSDLLSQLSTPAELLRSYTPQETFGLPDQLLQLPRCANHQCAESPEKLLKALDGGVTKDLGLAIRTRGQSFDKVC